MSCTTSIILILLGILIIRENKGNTKTKLVGCLLVIFGLFCFINKYLDNHKTYVSCVSIASNINGQIESYDKDILSCYNIDEFETRINNIFHMINYLQFTINSKRHNLSRQQLDVLNNLVKILQNKFIKSEVITSSGKKVTTINGKPSCGDFCMAEENKTTYDGKSCNCPYGYESKILPSGFVSCVLPSSISNVNTTSINTIEKLQSDIKQGVNNILSSYSNINCDKNICTFSNAPLKVEYLDKTIPLSSKIQASNSITNNVLPITHISFGKPQPKAIRKGDPYLKIYKKEIPIQSLNIALGDNSSIQEKINYIYNKVLDRNISAFGIAKDGNNLVIYFGDVEKSVSVSPNIFHNLESNKDISFYELGSYPVYEQATEYFALYKLN